MYINHICIYILYIYIYIYIIYIYIYYIYIYIDVFVFVCNCVCLCVCVLDPFHLERVNKLYQKYKPVSFTQKEHLLIWNSETNQKPKNLSL